MFVTKCIGCNTFWWFVSGTWTIFAVLFSLAYGMLTIIVLNNVLIATLFSFIIGITLEHFVGTPLIKKKLFD